MNCPSCGAPIIDSTKFCEYCGVRLPAPTEPQTAPSEPQDADDDDMFELPDDVIDLFCDIDDKSIYCCYCDDFDEKKLNNAVARYAYGIDLDYLLIQIDDTVFGSADDGCLITPDMIYVHDKEGSRKREITPDSEWEVRHGLLSGGSLLLDGEEIYRYTIPGNDSMEQLAEALNAMCEAMA